MQKLKLILLPLAFIFLFSCYYDEGPIISFSSSKARIVNKWKYSKVEENNIDITENFANRYLEFKKNGDVVNFIDDQTTFMGSWTLAEDRRSIKVVFIDDNDDSWTEEYNILKLKKDEMWLEDTFGATPKRYELVTF
ncbi:MAG: lipocalin family protein [Saprospiraceae bacterium]|nr:lipocalin family protein [Saprospiraceae bacterium]